MAEYAFTVVIERDEDRRFLAICPALQGCYKLVAAGRAEAEQLGMARELVGFERLTERMASARPD
jgi:predicted RNase H-like HicB family nuclease